MDYTNSETGLGPVAVSMAGQKIPAPTREPGSERRSAKIIHSPMVIRGPGVIRSQRRDTCGWRSAAAPEASRSPPDAVHRVGPLVLPLASEPIVAPAPSSLLLSPRVFASSSLCKMFLLRLITRGYCWGAEGGSSPKSCSMSLMTCRSLFSVATFLPWIKIGRAFSDWPRRIRQRASSR